MSADVALRQKAITRSQAWNCYTYGSNNPFVRIDPDGLLDIYVALWHLHYSSLSVGHAAAFELNGATILSQFPHPHAPYGRNDRLSYQATVNVEGRLPDHLYRVHIPDDAAFDKAVSAARSPKTKTWAWLPILSGQTNCSASLAFALTEGGFKLPFYIFAGPSILPDDLIESFEMLSFPEGHTVTLDQQQDGFWSVAEPNDILSRSDVSSPDPAEQMPAQDSKWLYENAFGSQIVVSWGSRP